MGLFTRHKEEPVEDTVDEETVDEETEQQVETRREIAELRAKRERIVGSAEGLPSAGTPERVIADRLDAQLDELLDRYEQQGQS